MMMARSSRICIAILAMSFAGSALAQTASVSGFVTDAANGQPLGGATVALYRVTEGYGGVPAYGTATDANGVHLIRRIEPGRYLLEVSFVGYRAHRETLELSANDTRTVTVGLAPDEEALEEVLIEAERQHGAARITAGHQRIRPEEIELIPAPDISSDLASYLSTLPGVVTTGDRGGQFFIRGGEPSQNLVLLDGMIVYQPFHVLGFYSAFPSEIVERVDFFAGGFGAKYASRLSSVIDVSARAGNNRRFAGMASASPFSGALRFEGPIVPGHASFLVSARQSLIDRTAETWYGESMPFEFSDVFAKVHAALGGRDRVSAAVFRTNDRGTLVAEIGDNEEQEIRWENEGGSLRWLMLPRSMPVVAELTLSRSMHGMEQGVPTDTVRSTVVRNTRLALDATFSEGAFFGSRSTTAAGWEVIFEHTRNELGGLFQNVESRGLGVTTFGVYVEPDLALTSDIRIQPGMRMQWYSVRQMPYLEPRLRAKWDRGVHHVSGAVGLYHQHVLGLNDRRDAASVFTAWTGVPRVVDRPARVRDVRQIGPQTFSVSIPLNEELDHIGGELIRGRLGAALHGLLGYRTELTPWMEVSLEGFYKRVTNLFVGELTPLPRLTTRLLPATGRSIGFEARAEIRRRPWYAYITYGISITNYAADGRAISFGYGNERIRYRPSHDRRHQINTVVSATLGGFDIGVRWQFGSGLPYTHPLAFDGFVLVDRIDTVFDLDHSRRVLYDAPFGAELPTYHRLDASIEKTWNVRRAALTLQASAINLYDRRNIFYVDTFTLARKDQLPFVPSLGLMVAFE